MVTNIQKMNPIATPIPIPINVGGHCNIVLYISFFPAVFDVSALVTTCSRNIGICTRPIKWISLRSIALIFIIVLTFAYGFSTYTTDVVLSCLLIPKFPRYFNHAFTLLLEKHILICICSILTFSLNLRFINL